MGFPIKSLDVRSERIPHAIAEHTGVLGYELLSQNSYSMLQKAKRCRISLKMAFFSFSIITEWFKMHNVFVPLILQFLGTLTIGCLNECT